MVGRGGCDQARSAAHLAGESALRIRAHQDTVPEVDRRTGSAVLVHDGPGHGPQGFGLVGLPNPRARHGPDDVAAEQGSSAERHPCCSARYLLPSRPGGQEACGAGH